MTDERVYPEPLPPSSPHEELRYSQALWYAWGRGDGGDDLIGSAFDFARLYLDRLRVFEEGRTMHMPSMMDAFERWNEGDTLDGDKSFDMVSKAKKAAEKAVLAVIDTTGRLMPTDPELADALSNHGQRYEQADIKAIYPCARHETFEHGTNVTFTDGWAYCSTDGGE